MRRKLSVYIHIPFCVKKCFYCDFLSFPAPAEEREVYVQALLREIEAEAARYAGDRIETVFFGGGTPSLLWEGQIGNVLERLASLLSLSGDAEITMEVNPGTAAGDRLKGYRRAGVNRLSIGTQSLQDGELARLGRIHRAEDFYKTYEAARGAGFENINVDIMAALPGQKEEAYMDTLHRVAEVGPEHISAYSLIVEENTPFWELYGEGRQPAGQPPLPAEEEERRLDGATERFLEAQGYRRYEISNYAREGRECRHNMACWKRYDYVGFGLGAASMVDNVRWRNTPDMSCYLAGAGGPGDGIREQMQRLSEAEQMEEFMFLGLRLTEGVSAEDFGRLFGRDIYQVYGKTIEKLSRQGLLLADRRLRLTPYGRDISNYVMAEFLF